MDDWSIGAFPGSPLRGVVRTTWLGGPHQIKRTKMVERQRQHPGIESRQVGTEMLGIRDLDVAQVRRIAIAETLRRRVTQRGKADRNAIVIAAMDDYRRQSPQLARCKKFIDPRFYPL